MRLFISTTDITPILTKCTWSGARTQSARKLQFSFLQNPADKNFPAVNVDCGFTVRFFDDSNNLAFQGNIYNLEKDSKNAAINITAYDNLFVLNRSKTTKKFDAMSPAEIARVICAEMGVKCGNIAEPNCNVSFIANSKTGFQIIQGAYTEAKKQNGKIYQCLMDGDSLCVIEKGELCGVIADSNSNMTDSVYKESIENLVNAVLVVDEQGNSTGESFSDSNSISKYSMFVDVYKSQKDKDTKTEANGLLTKPEREGYITALGDFRAVSGYSLIVRDSNFNGKFYIKSDSHSFDAGFHQMQLQLEFENLMNEVEVEKSKKE